MTPKQRMNIALQGGIPDRVPIAPYFWGAEYRWKVLGLEIWELLHGEPDISFFANDRLYERHPCDWIFVHGFGDGWLTGKTVEERDGRVFITDVDGTEYEFLRDGHHIVRVGATTQRHANTGITDKNIRTKADVERLLGPKREIRPGTPHIAEDHWQRRLIRKHGNEMFMVAGGISPFVHACYTLGFETSLIMMKENPSAFLYLEERLFEDSLTNYEWIATCGYDAILIAESWASVDIISPRQYAEFAFPYQKAAIDAAHAQGLKAILYSTGSLLPILPKMRELDADALTMEEGRKGEPIDIGAVRNIVGSKQCLFGNFDAEEVLLRGNRDQVETEVVRQIRSAGQDGAFILGTGSPICDATSPAQIDLLLELTRQHGEYGNDQTH